MNFYMYMIDLQNMPKTVSRVSIIDEQIARIKPVLAELCRSVTDSPLVDQMQQALLSVAGNYQVDPQAALETARTEARRLWSIHRDYDVPHPCLSDLRELYDNLVGHITYYISGPKEVPVMLLI
jgi:hypothetical protein